MKKWMFLILLILCGSVITFWQYRLITPEQIAETPSKVLEEELRRGELLKEGMAMSALRLQAEHALLWSIEPGEQLKVFHVDRDHELRELGLVTICQVSKSDAKGQGIVLVAGEEEEIRRLIRSKYDGHIELARTR